MKRLFVWVMALVSVSAFGQNITELEKVAVEATSVVSQAPKVAPVVVKPKYWTSSLKTQINIGQTSLTNWAAGGDNLVVSMQGFIDAGANYKKSALFWNNRLQLEYGFLYASSKPILQKNTDRIYLESKFGYQAIENLFLSANFDFKSQFSNTYEYPTPTKKSDGTAFGPDEKPTKADWSSAKKLKSGFLSPAYTNLALGIDYKPFKWLSLNLAPLTGGFVIVKDPVLRSNYSMPLKKKFNGLPADSEELKQAKENGTAYKHAKFEFGAQLKMDIAVNVNDNFKYTSQVVLFSNYLDHPENLRVNWDNRFDWKLAKYFSLTFMTNLIYDDNVKIATEKDPVKKARVQFRENLAFGFVYTIASK